MPTFNDLYYFRLGSRTLRPEKANEYSIGATYGHSLFPAMDYLNVTIDAYYNDVTDKIVAFPTTYAWRMVNFGKVRVTGLDITLATSVALPLDLDLILTGAYTWQKAIDLTDSKAANYKDQVPYTPGAYRQHVGNTGDPLAGCRIFGDMGREAVLFLREHKSQRDRRLLRPDAQRVEGCKPTQLPAHAARRDTESGRQAI